MISRSIPTASSHCCSNSFCPLSTVAVNVPFTTSLILSSLYSSVVASVVVSVVVEAVESVVVDSVVVEVEESHCWC